MTPVIMVASALTRIVIMTLAAVIGGISANGAGYIARDEGCRGQGSRRGLSAGLGRAVRPWAEAPARPMLME
jgi:hypothetical protein